MHLQVYREELDEPFSAGSFASVNPPLNGADASNLFLISSHVVGASSAHSNDKHWVWDLL